LGFEVNINVNLSGVVRSAGSLGEEGSPQKAQRSQSERQREEVVGIAEDVEEEIDRFATVSKRRVGLGLPISLMWHLDAVRHNAALHAAA